MEIACDSAELGMTPEEFTTLLEIHRPLFVYESTQAEQTDGDEAFSISGARKFVFFRAICRGEFSGEGRLVRTTVYSYD